MNQIEMEQLGKVHSFRSAQEMFTEGEHLYYEGDTAQHVYSVYKGWVILYKSLENGNRQILRFALPGDLLCFKVGRNKVLDHSAIAVSDTSLCVFPIERFKKTVKELPELAVALSSMSCVISERYHSMLTTIASHPAETKVAFLLLSLYIRQRRVSGKKDDGDYCAHFPIKQEDISDALGITSIHVNRVLQSLRKKGLIECKNKCLKVPDQQALAAVAKVDLESLKNLMLGT
jgi:CRP-like cAMP-binding protein